MGRARPVGLGGCIVDSGMEPLVLPCGRGFRPERSPPLASGRKWGLRRGGDLPLGRGWAGPLGRGLGLGVALPGAHLWAWLGRGPKWEVSWVRGSGRRRFQGVK